MPPRAPVHFNPPQNVGWTRCGIPLANVAWTPSPEDVTCNNCVRCIQADKRPRGRRNG